MCHMPQWTSRELKKPCTCLIKTIRTMVVKWKIQMLLAMRYRSAFAFKNIRSALCSNRRSSQPWEDINFTCKHCIDILRTPVEDCRHLGVKICMRGRKGKQASRTRYDYRWSRTYLPYIKLSVVLKYQIRRVCGFVAPSSAEFRGRFAVPTADVLLQHVAEPMPYPWNPRLNEKDDGDKLRVSAKEVLETLIHELLWKNNRLKHHWLKVITVSGLVARWWEMYSRTPQNMVVFLLKPNRRAPITAERIKRVDHGAIRTQWRV